MENEIKKCIYVTGPEGSGSKLIAKICAHVLGIKEFGKWNGVGSIENSNNIVVHRSLPYGNPPKYPDINSWLDLQQNEYTKFFILSSRDINISELSRYKKYAKSLEQAQDESDHARKLMIEILNSNCQVFLWSYETFMFLKDAYLKKLYMFLKLQSDFSPELIDGNKNKIKLQ